MKKKLKKPLKKVIKTKVAVVDPSRICCFICGNPIPEERIEFLRSTGIPEHEMTTVNCSQTKKKKGMYMGEHGTSEMKIVDKVYNDSVRDVFRRSTVEAMEDMTREDEDNEQTNDPGFDDAVNKIRPIEHDKEE